MNEVNWVYEICQTDWMYKKPTNDDEKSKT